MKVVALILTTLLLGLSALPASAQAPDTAKAVVPVKLQAASPKVSQIIIPKDPLLSGYLSATTPGLGQLYCGRFWRAAGFLAAEGLCFGVAAGIAKKANPEFTYTVFDSAGNPHELIGRESDKTAKDKFTDRDRTNIAIFTIAGAALHVWNVLDAYRLAKSHNKKMFLGSRPDETGIKVGLEMKAAGPSLSLTRRF
jgi:hypothetical protein